MSVIEAVPLCFAIICSSSFLIAKPGKVVLRGCVLLRVTSLLITTLIGKLTIDKPKADTSLAKRARL